MFSRNQTQVRRNLPSLRSRVMRGIIAVIMVVALVAGILAFLAVRNDASTRLAHDQSDILSAYRQEIVTRLEFALDDTAQLARGDAVKNFARETQAINSTRIESSQTQLLTTFLDLLSHSPGQYAAARYVTRNGSIWTEVTDYDVAQTQTTAQIGRLGEDTALRDSLRLNLGEVAMGPLSFRTDENGQVAQPLTAIFRFSSPVSYTEDATNVPGVVELDILAAPILNSIDAPLAQFPSLAGRRFMLVNNTGQIFADSDQPDATFLTRLAANQNSPLTDDAERQVSQLVRANPALLSLESADVAGNIVSNIRIATGSSPDMPWSLVILDDPGVALAQANVAGVAALLISLAVGVALSLFINNRMAGALRPIGVANAAAQKMVAEGGSSSQESLAFVAQDDEIGQLLRSFDQISRRVRTLTGELESQENRYSRNLEITARIGRETATLRDVDHLLNRAIDLICEEFGYYHAQVFLVDDVGMNAVLAYSHGEAGKRLLEQGHKIAVGSESVIGSVTKNGTLVVINDTTSPTGPHRFNPLLPDTRAEMALPLQTGDQIIGALDIQSNRSDVFHREETRTFQVLADQIAIAIYNARLLIQSDERIRQIDSLNRQLTRMAWEESGEQTSLESSYRYDLLRVERGEAKDADKEGKGDASAMSAPIAIRGQVIGTLAASIAEGQQFSENDSLILKAVADRVALAIENARLFQETQVSLAETSTLYQISRYLNEANSLEDVIQAVVVSVMTDAVGGQIAIFDEYPAGASPRWVEISTDWAAQEEADWRNLSGTRLHLADHPLLDGLRPNQVALVQDIRRDTRVDNEMREFLTHSGGQAAVLIPFSVRGVWRGAVIFEFPEPREFTEREGRVYNALIDQAGLTIDNRLLLYQTETALSQIERLYAASRIINTAQTLPEMIRAAVTTTSDPSFDFGLGLLEGDLDRSGWPTRVHLVAQSRRGEVAAIDRHMQVIVKQDSLLRFRQPEVASLADLESTPDMAQWMKEEGRQFVVTFPLFSAAQPIALFYLISQQEKQLSEEDYEVYRALTGQMSTVLQNRRLLEQTEQALDETRRLYRASSDITSAKDSNEVYQAAAKHLSEGLASVSLVTILLAGPTPSVDAPYLDHAYVWTHDGQILPDSDRMSSSYAPFGRFMQAIGQATRFDDLRHELADWPQIQRFFRRNEAVSAMIAPVQTRQKWFGVLICTSHRVAAFDEQYTRFAQAIADQMAVAVENRQLFDEARSQAQRALALAEAGQLATRIGGEFERSIGEVFTRVAEPADYDRWLLMLLDDSGDRLVSVTQHLPGQNGSEEQPVSFEMTTEHSIVDSVQQGQTLLVNAPDQYPAFANYPPEYSALIGKHIVTPLRIGRDTIGALLVGRSLTAADLDGRDEQLVNTLAAQVAIALENRRLFLTAESERNTLRSILDTLPAGVLVLDAKTYRPLQTNSQTELLLGRPVDMENAFDLVAYNVHRSGSANEIYPEGEMPIFSAAQVGEPTSSDDVAVYLEDGSHIDLLVNAAPIYDAKGDVTVIVAAFQDISNLRSLENTLQDNLRETIALYEATRSLAEAREAEDVLDLVISQLRNLAPSEAYVLLLDEEVNGAEVARSLSGTRRTFELPSEVLVAHEPLLVNNVHHRNALDEGARLALDAARVKALMSFPLRSRSGRDVPMGWLVLTFDEPHDMSPEEERFVTTLSDSAAIALDNRYLILSTEDALNETSALYNAATAISRARELDQLAGAIQAAMITLSPDMYAGYLFDQPNLTIPTELFNISLDDAPAEFKALVTRHRTLLEGNMYIDDLRSLDSLTPLERDILGLGNIRSVAMVPLRIKGAPSGCLLIAYHHPHHFREGDARFLSAVADSASVVVDNIVLFQQIQTTLEETSTLYLASRALANVVRPEDILDIVVKHLMDEQTTIVFMATLLSSSWELPGAFVQVTSSWQREGAGAIDLQGVTLTEEQFPAWRQLATHDVLFIGNVAEDDTLSPLEKMGIESMEIRSLSVIPLRAARRAIGAIWIGSNEVRTHSETQHRVYQSFAEQASLSLEALRLLAQTERRARQLATSSEVSQFASSILDLDELLPRIVDLIRDSFHYDHVQVFLMDTANDYAELRASTGEAGQQLLSIRHKLQKGSASVIGQVTATGSPSIALDTADARVVHRPNPYLPHTRSEMAVPLTLKGAVVGALDVQSNQPNAFDEDDVSILTTLAAQISVALDNARLFNQSFQRANEMTFLFDVTTKAASADNLTSALKQVAGEIRETLDAVSASIYLPETFVDEDENPFTMIRPVALAGGAGQPLSELAEVRLDQSQNTIASVAESRRHVIINNIENEPTYLPIAPSAQSAIIVPLTSGAQLIGLMVVESEALNAYDDETLTLLQTMAGTLSAIVQNTQLLEQVQKTIEQLRELDRLKTDFLANMSHELRTPLNSIIGFSRVILKGIDGPLTEMQEQDLTTIYNSGQHLLNLINDILDQAKIAAGKMDLQSNYFEVKPVIDGVRSIGIGLVKDKNIDIYVDMASGLPKAYGDEFRTRQVLLNLVSNAAKFTREGSITISVFQTFDAELERQMVRIDVTDSGIGIADKDLPLLFEAFRQVDSSLTRTVGGTGLGLPIAKSLIEMQGGRMEVKSQVNVGSTFSIFIPLEPVEVEETPDEKTPRQKPTGPLPGTGALKKPQTNTNEVEPAKTTNTEESLAIQAAYNPMHAKRQILLIEDNPDMVDQFRRALQREGFDIYAASIPLEAEAMASGLHPTIVIMDVDFSNGAGWDILRKLKDRDDTLDIPVVVVTLNNDEQRARDLHVHSFIRRPFMPDELVTAVQEAERESRVDRILIIDDRPDDVRLLRQLLDEHGHYRVFTAHSGAEGIAIVARRRPNLVILDLRMPEMDGFTVVKELRSNPETANIPILVVTGETLNSAERTQLSSLSVLSKADISLEDYRNFIEGVRTHLAGFDGERRN